MCIKIYIKSFVRLKRNFQQETKCCQLEKELKYFILNFSCIPCGHSTVEAKKKS